jgi:hypothetical protein
MTRQLLTLAIRIPAGTAPDAARTLALMAGRLGCSAVHLEAVEDHSLEELAAAAAPALVIVDTGDEAPGMVTVNDPEAVARERAQLDASDATRPLLVAVPISIGRTMSEAIARADLEPRFAHRHPRDVGIFGTFEQAQKQVLALARAGADGLILDIPLARDVADILAQVRALVVGATPHLVDAPDRSPAPAPQTVFYGD